MHKLKSLAAHISNSGLPVFISTKLYDYFIRLRLLLAGINFNKTKAQLAQATAESLNNDAHENQASSFYILKKGLEVLPLPLKEIALLDIGCGSGRVMNYCMLRKVKSVAGIDLDTDALHIAEANCKLLFDKGYKTTCSVASADATTYIIPVSVNVIYLFNPFGRQTMQSVAENMVRHVAKTGTPLFVIYTMPAFKDIFENSNACTKIHERFNKDKSRSELVVFKVSA